MPGRSLHPITTIYFDSEPLSFRWPELPPAVQKVCGLAKQMEITVCLPAPVQTELEWQFRREVEAAWDKASAAYKDFRDTAGIESSISDVDIEAVMSEYRSRVDRLLTTHSIDVRPMTTRPISDLFQHAVKRFPPFRVTGQKGHARKDSGFKDAVIAFSVIDDLRPQPWHARAVLVSNDSGYFGIERFVFPPAELTVASIDEVLASLQTGRALAELADQEIEVTGLLISPGDMMPLGFDLSGDGAEAIVTCERVEFELRAPAAIGTL